MGAFQPSRNNACVPPRETIYGLVYGHVLLRNLRVAITVHSMHDFVCGQSHCVLICAFIA